MQPPSPVLQIHDDGCDITRSLVRTRPTFLDNVNSLVEQTICGVSALRSLYRHGLLNIPAIEERHDLEVINDYRKA